jgi:hypothetical protein
LSGLLHACGMPVQLLDLNHEGIEYLLAKTALYESSAVLARDPTPTRPDAAPAEECGRDTWTRRALEHSAANCAALRSPGTYRHFKRYERAVLDLNKALKVISKPFKAEAGLANYTDSQRSPLRSQDLLDAAIHHRSSPFYPLFKKRIETVLASVDISAIGVSLNYVSQALPAFALLGFLSEHWPEIPRILGGGLVTSWCAQALRHQARPFAGLVDTLLPGPAEVSLARLLASDSLPSQMIGQYQTVPDFSDFSSHAYFAPVKILPFNFSSGCPWKRCTFCPEQVENSPYRSLSTGAALMQLGNLATAYHPGLLHITDSEIATNHLRALAEHGPGLPWYGFARFGESLTDPGFCRALAGSGCKMLQLGFESGDQQVLDAMGKGTSLPQIERILENLAKASIGTYLYILFGTPAEDRTAALRTRDWLVSRADLIDFMNIAIFNMPMGSVDAARLVSRPFDEGDLALYTDFEHPAGWNRRDIRSFIANEFADSIAIRTILSRTPPVFTSSHAAFFL